MCALQVLQHRQQPKNSSSIDLSFTSSSSILPSITSSRFSRSPESQQIGSPLNTSNEFASKIAQISNQVRSNSKSCSTKREANNNMMSHTSARSLNSTQNIENNVNINNSSEFKLVTSSISSDYGIPAAPPISSNNNNNNVGSATFSIKVAVRVRPFNDREIQTYRAAKMIKAREEYIIATARAEQEQDERPSLKRRGSQANLMLKELLKDVSSLTNNGTNGGGNSVTNNSLIGTSASARLPFEKQLRHGADSGGLSSRLNISHLISQSLLPNKIRSGTSSSSSTTTATSGNIAAGVEVLGKDLERSLRSLVERDSDNQLNITSNNNGIDSFVCGANNNRGVNFMSAIEVSAHNNNVIEGIDMNDEPEPIIDVEPDEKTVLLLDPFHPGKAKGVFTFDFVVSSFAPSVEIADSIDTNSPSHSSSNQHKGHHDKSTKNHKKESSNALLRHKEKANKAELEQLTLYNELALPLVEVLLRGYNACVFAYGQTSSGKTYTMFGTRDVPGIVPRMCKELFKQMASASLHDPPSLSSLTNNPNTSEHHEHKSHSKHKSKKDNTEEEEEEEDERHKLQLASSLRGQLHGLNGYTVVMSYLEIYNEQVRDLLHGCAGALIPSSGASNDNNNNNNTNSGDNSSSKKNGNGPSSNTSALSARRSSSAYMNFSTSSTFANHLPLDNYDGRTLKVRTHPTNGVFVEGLSTFQVCSFDECERLLKHGNTSRTSSATAMNATSSRSHAILQLTITKKEELQGCKVCGQTVMLNNQTSKLNLVDLAGSERSNVDELPGSRHRIETNNINVSLSTLRRVIESLVSRSQALGNNSSSSSANNSKALHLPPYRESVLTYLLSDNFGGNSRTVMCATVSPSEMNFAETESTLRYAAIARGIRLHVKVNESPAAKLIKSLQTRVALLSNELTKCMTSVISSERLKEIGVNPDNYINGKFALDCSRSIINMTSDNNINNSNNNNSNNELITYWKNEANRQRRRADELEQQLSQSKGTELNNKSNKNPKLTVAELGKLAPHSSDKLSLPNLRALAMASPMFPHGRVTPLSLLNLRNASDLKLLDTSAGQIRNSVTNTSIESSGSRQSYLLGHQTRLPQFPSSSPCSSLRINHNKEENKEIHTSAPNVSGTVSETRRSSNTGSNNSKKDNNKVNRSKIDENNVNDANNNSISKNSMDRNLINNVKSETRADLNQRRPTLKPSAVVNTTTTTTTKPPTASKAQENEVSKNSSNSVNNANKKSTKNSAAHKDVNTSQELRNSNDKAVANRRVKRQSSNESNSDFSPRSSSQTSLSLISDQDINAAKKVKKSHHNKTNVPVEPVEAAATNIEKGQWETEAILQPSKTKKETKRGNKSREQNTEKMSQEMKPSITNKHRKISLNESMDSSMLENSSDEGVFEPVKKQMKENSLDEQLMQFQRAKMQNGVKK